MKYTYSKKAACAGPAPAPRGLAPQGVFPPPRACTGPRRQQGTCRSQAF